MTGVRRDVANNQILIHYVGLDGSLHDVTYGPFRGPE